MEQRVQKLVARFIEKVKTGISMISLLVSGFFSMVERELVKYTPEIQAYILKELQVGATLFLTRLEAKVAEKEGLVNEQR